MTTTTTTTISKTWRRVLTGRLDHTTMWWIFFSTVNFRPPHTQLSRPGLPQTFPPGFKGDDELLPRSRFPSDPNAPPDLRTSTPSFFFASLPTLLPPPMDSLSTPSLGPLLLHAPLFKDYLFGYKAQNHTLLQGPNQRTVQG